MFMLEVLAHTILQVLHTADGIGGGGCIVASTGSATNAYPSVSGGGATDISTVRRRLLFR